MPGPHNWRHRFKGHVSRWTVPREAILEFLSKSSKHMSAKEIYASLCKSYPGMGLTTIYRTLELLARMGFITKLTLGDGQSRYDTSSNLAKKRNITITLFVPSVGKLSITVNSWMRN